IIGQGYVLTPPLQLSAATAVLALKGKHVTPQVAQFGTPEQTPDIQLSNPHDWDLMHEAMLAVVTDRRGTARRIATPLYSIAAKSGTSQVFSLSNEEENNADEIGERIREHALLVGFAAANNTAFVFDVLGEMSGGGGSVAGG